MKIKNFFFLSLLLPVAGYAGSDYDMHDTPDVEAYLAEKAELPPPPKLEFPYPEGFYIGATVGGITDVEFRIEDQLDDVLATFKNNKTVTQGGASIGYLFKEAGWLNQIEFQYIFRDTFKFDTTGTITASLDAIPGVLPEQNLTITGNLDSQIKNQTGMVKVYSTLNIYRNIFPYIYAAGGFSLNKAEANLAIAAASNSLYANLAGRTRTSTTTGAAGAGAGVRLRISKQIMFDMNYEYTYMGKIKDWVFTPSSTADFNPETDLLPSLTIAGDRLRGQSFNFSVLFQPWGFYSEGD